MLVAVGLRHVSLACSTYFSPLLTIGADFDLHGREVVLFNIPATPVAHPVASEPHAFHLLLLLHVDDDGCGAASVGISAQLRTIGKVFVEELAGIDGGAGTVFGSPVGTSLDECSGHLAGIGDGLDKFRLGFYDDVAEPALFTGCAVTIDLSDAHRKQVGRSGERSKRIGTDGNLNGILGNRVAGEDGG